LRENYKVGDVANRQRVGGSQEQTCWGAAEINTFTAGWLAVLWASPWEIGELNNGTKNGKRKDERET
jgi:hypothetical protein